jgi:predicted Zn-dependent protease
VKSRLISVVVAVALGAAATFSAAAPRRADPDLVVLHVEPLSPARRSTVASLQEALDTVAELLDAGRRTGQARYAGRAEAMLDSWRSRAAGSARWHVLAADLRQYRHEYSRALSLLGRALELEPRNTRALLMRAAIHQAQGNYRPARKDCATLVGFGESLLGSTCLAQVLGLTGQLDGAIRLLDSLLKNSGADAPPSIRSWMLSALADMHERRGNPRIAESLLREALAIEPRSLYLELTLADLLLAQDRPVDATGVLGDLPLIPAVRLRIAAAEHALGEPVAAHLEHVLRAFNDSRLRGERLEQQELARFARLQNNTREALAAARANWSLQREPVDLRLLIAAAIDARDGKTLREAQEWMKLTGYQDALAETWLARASNLRAGDGKDPPRARPPT